jgi:hypothetical protein
VVFLFIFSGTNYIITFSISLVSKFFFCLFLHYSGLLRNLDDLIAPINPDYRGFTLLCLEPYPTPFPEIETSSLCSAQLSRLLPEDGDRIQSPKRCVLNKNGKMDNVQKPKIEFVKCSPTAATLTESIHIKSCWCADRDPGFDSRLYQIFWEVGSLERGSLSLMRITQELLEWKNRGSGSTKSRLTAVGIRCADHTTPSIRKSWH